MGKYKRLPDVTQQGGQDHWLVKGLWIIPIVLLATCSRLYQSTASAIWCDEGSSLLLSHYSPALIWYHSAHDVHPPLYFWLLHVWITAFGNGILSIRLLSVLTGIATVAVGVWLVLKVSSRRAAMLAGILLALFPIAVRYSQEVRMYSLMGLLLLSATLALVYWVKNPERHRYLVIYTALMAASFYTHYFTGLCVLSHWLYLFTLREQKYRLITRPTWWMANAAIVLMYTPWLPNLLDLFKHLDQLKAGGDIGWIAPVNEYSLFSTLWQDFTLTDGLQLDRLFYFALPLTMALLAGYVCIRDTTAYKFVGLLTIYAALPLALIFIISWKTPLLVERYLLFSALGLPLVLAIAIDRLGRRLPVMAGVIFLLVVGVEIDGLSNNYHTDAQQVDALVEYVNKSYAPGDSIVVNDLFWYFSVVYYNKTGALVQLYTPPLADGSSSRPNNYGFGTLVEADTQSIYVDDLKQLGGQSKRVWLISSTDPVDDVASFPANWKVKSKFDIGDVQVRAFTIDNPPIALIPSSP